MNPDRLAARAEAEALEILGGFHPVPEDGLPGDAAAVLLLGPREPGFWAHVTRSPEFADGAADPLDRWSRRIVGGLAAAAGGTALFPFDGPPWHPFPTWATRTGRAWTSPATLLVHATAGLMVSIRGAIALRDRVALPAPALRPCDACPGQPCRTACPAAALGPGGYDVPACKTHVGGPDGRDCLTLGCAVRRACPVSRSYARAPAQSEYHMRRFLG